ncbi:MAG: hypothetical protein JXB48_00865 [Candidatus Latescibacteria bacterium]|nr:hypothetical protein [Candidatus Latescibacterota bacterium]
MKKTVIAFGEILWDILPDDTILGGAPFNFINRVNSLGERGLIVSRIGRDEQGQKAYEAVDSLGLETGYIQWDEKYPTGTVQVSFEENNNPDYAIIPGVAYDYIGMTDSLTEIASKADCICFGTLIQRSEKSRNTLEKLLEISSQSIKVLDINLRKKCYSKETIIFSLDKADVLKLNEDEAVILSHMLELHETEIPRLCNIMTETWSLRYCIVTFAEKGAYLCTDSGQAVYEPGFKVQYVDSVGSGDAFTAGFVHAILNGETPQEACRLGNILGALVA